MSAIHDKFFTHPPASSRKAVMPFWVCGYGVVAIRYASTVLLADNKEAEKHTMQLKGAAARYGYSVIEVPIPARCFDNAPKEMTKQDVREWCVPAIRETFIHDIVALAEKDMASAKCSSAFLSKWHNFVAFCSKFRLRVDKQIYKLYKAKAVSYHRHISRQAPHTEKPAEPLADGTYKRCIKTHYQNGEPCKLSQFRQRFDWEDGLFDYVWRNYLIAKREEKIEDVAAFLRKSAQMFMDDPRSKFYKSKG